MAKIEPRRTLSRRAFVRQGALLLAAPMLYGGDAWAEPPEAKPAVRIGLVTDLHYADRNPAGTRYYRETLGKLQEAVKRFGQDKTDAVIELGDLIDGGDSLDAEKEYLRRIVKEFRAAPGRHHYVLGNHCVYALTKAEFLEAVGEKETYYCFDLAGWHFVILDGCFRQDGTPYGRKNFEWTDAYVPPAELDWLRADLRQTPHKCVVFVHQRLDVAPPYGIKNAATVRQILEASGKVLGVLQGHYHRGDYRQLGGIHYCTLTAMVEGPGPAGNAYAVMDILPGGAVRIAGFRKQRSHEWS